jgi:hypothetical protein
VRAVVHEKRLAPAAIGFASEQGIELLAIDRVPAWDGGFGEAEDRGKQVLDSCLLALNGTGRDRKPFSERRSPRLLSPRRR